jgi:di/tricarboxylate transporter
MTDLSAAAARSEAEGRPGAGALLAEQMAEAGDKRPRRRDIRPLARLLPYAMRHKGHALAAFFWLVAAAVAALGVTVIHLVVLPLMFPTGKESALPRAQMQHALDDMGPLKPQEWSAAGGFVFFLLGSATAGWHHVKPAYLAGCVLLGLLLTGALLRKDFQRQLDWPMIFFLLGIDSLMRIMDHLGLAGALARALDQRFDFVGGNIAVFIAVALAVTLTVRLALPVTAGMLTAAIVLLPVAAALTAVARLFTVNLPIKP